MYQSSNRMPDRTSHKSGGLFGLLLTEIVISRKREGGEGNMGDTLLQFVQAVCLILILKKLNKR